MQRQRWRQTSCWGRAILGRGAPPASRARVGANDGQKLRLASEASRRGHHSGPTASRERSHLDVPSPQARAIDTQVGAQAQISSGPVPPADTCRPSGGEAPASRTPVAFRPPLPQAGADLPRARTLIARFARGWPGFFWLGCDKSVTAKRSYWPRMALDRGRGIAVKYRIALAFVATSCMAGMSFAADLPVSGPYRPGPFMVRQPVEWTGLYFGANAGYGWGQYSSNITFTGLQLTLPGGTTTPFGLGPDGVERNENRWIRQAERRHRRRPDRLQLAGRDVRLRRGDRRPVVGAGEHLYDHLRGPLHRHRIDQDQIARDRARTLRFGVSIGSCLT